MKRSHPLWGWSFTHRVVPGDAKQFHFQQIGAFYAKAVAVKEARLGAADGMRKSGQVAGELRTGNVCLLAARESHRSGRSIKEESLRAKVTFPGAYVTLVLS